MFKIKKILNHDPHITRLVILFIAILAFMAFARGNQFFQIRVFRSMATQFPEFGMLALGIVLCLITGGIDLSGVGIANLSSVLGAFIMIALVPEGTPVGQQIPAILLAMLVMVVIGITCGVINGLIITKLHVPPILVTLGTFQIFTGIAVILTGGSAITGIPVGYRNLLSFRVFDAIPLSAVFFIVTVVIIGILMSKTKFGTQIILIGTNQKAAHFSGIKVDRILIRTYLYSGLLATFAGIIMMANYSSAKADYGQQYTLQCVLIAILGGVSPTGGKGNIWGVVLSIAVVQLIFSALNMLRISTFYTSLVWGAVLIIVMLIDYYTTARKLSRISKQKQ